MIHRMFEVAGLGRLHTRWFTDDAKDLFWMYFDMFVHDVRDLSDRR